MFVLVFRNSVPFAPAACSNPSFECLADFLRIVAGGGELLDLRNHLIPARSRQLFDCVVVDPASSNPDPRNCLYIVIEELEELAKCRASHPCGICLHFEND